MFIIGAWAMLVYYVEKIAPWFLLGVFVACVLGGILHMLKKRGVLVVALLLLLPASVCAAQAVTLTWQDNANNETGQNVKRKSEACLGPSPFTQYAVVAANVITFVDNAVVQGQTYCYEVTAFNPGGESLPSNTAEVTVGFTVPPSPSNLLAK